MIQIDFLTQITMLSSQPGHVSLIRKPEWKAQSVCLTEIGPDAFHQGMLIIQAWPGPLWAAHDKENQPILSNGMKAWSAFVPTTLTQALELLSYFM